MKLKIDNEQLAEEFFENTHLLGIVAPVKSYQFIWHINQQLGCNFRLNNDIEIELRKILTGSGRDKMMHDFNELERILGGPGASEQVAIAIVELIK